MAGREECGPPSLLISGEDEIVRSLLVYRLMYVVNVTEGQRAFVES